METGLGGGRFDKEEKWQMGRGREIVPKTEQLRKILKVWKDRGF